MPPAGFETTSPASEQPQTARPLGSATKYLASLKTGTYQVVPTVKHRWQYTAVILSRIACSVHETSVFSEGVKCGLWVSCTEPQNLYTLNDQNKYTKFTIQII
jgi:hypothetical protein